MKFKPNWRKFPHVSKPKVPRSVDCFFGGRIMNYNGWYSLATTRDEKRFDQLAKRRFWTKLWKRARTHKKHQDIISRIRGERERAYRFHYHPVILSPNYVKRSYVEPPEIDEVKDWMAKNCNSNTKYHLELLSDTFRFVHVYWFEDPEEAMLFRLTFSE